MARKVLVADDSVTIQKVVGLTFANEDIELSFVDNGEEAITLAKRIKPDLILADVLMPGKSGYEVCESVKTDPELRHIPVLLLTGTFEPFDADRCAKVGANGTITKPFESQTLIREVRELLDRPVNGKAPATAPSAVAQTSADAPVAAPQAPPDPNPEAAWPEEEVPAEAGPSWTQPEVPAEPEPAWTEPEVPAEPEPAWTEPEAPAEPEPAWTEPEAPAEPAATDSGLPAQALPVPEEVVADTLAFERNLAGEDTQGGGDPADQPLAFTREPELALNRKGVDAPQTPEEGAPASWTEAPSPDPPVEQPLVAPVGEDVWDLSDFESVDESQIEPLPEDALVEESDALWNEAAAEAIDLVETTNLEADNEVPVETDTAPLPSLDAPLAGPRPEVAAEAGEGIKAPPANHATDDPLGSSPIQGEAVFEAFDLGPDSQGDLGEMDAPVVDEPQAVPGPVADPAGPTPGEQRAEADLPVLVPEESGLEEVSFEALPDSPAAAPEQPAPEFAAAPHPAPREGEDLASLTGLPADRSASIVSEAVKDAVEKFTWEAFGDLPETVVRAVQEKVEKIAWEVIPQMAETIIKEEIRRLKKDGE